MSEMGATAASAGSHFRRALEEESPLQIVGVVNAYCALLAEKAGFRAVYLSGGGVANASFGLPDLGMTTMSDVLEDARRITGASDLPLLVDVDTGWGGALNIARTVRAFIQAGVAAIHIEDQERDKRCGHRPNKAVVPTSEMCERIEAAVDARTQSDFVIMARTDALAVEGFDSMLERIDAYARAGADAIFAEAMRDIESYAKVAAAVDVPVLANLTEFGLTPLYTVEELGAAGIRMALYPLSAFRAMSAAANKVYETIRRDGTQRAVVESMQTREELYDVLDYHSYEAVIDALRGESKP